MTTAQTFRLDLRSNIYRDDPWTEFGRLRDTGPVVRIKIPIMGKSWAATTFEAASAVLKDSEQFVRDPMNAGRKNQVYFQWLLPRPMKALFNNMLGADGAEHRRLRSLVDQAFNRRNMDGMTARLETLAAEQMDMVEQIARRDGKVDLVEHYTRPLPLTVICELLGLPLEDRPKFAKWFLPLSTVKSLLGVFKIGRGLGKVNEYLLQQFEEARRNPREGLITELVQAEHEGHKLTDKELLAMVFLLLVAGHETTVHLINNMLLCLMQFPEAKQELLKDWSKTDGAIEETLRYATPLQITKPRFVAHDMEFHGQQLKRGETIVPIIASANYDPARFDNPREFRIDRKQNYHLSFGSGPHTCLGMKLARAETHHAIKTLWECWPELQPEFDLQHPNWSARIGTRSLKTMFVRPSD